MVNRRPVPHAHRVDDGPQELPITAEEATKERLARLLAGDSDDQLVPRGFFAINTTPTGADELLAAYERSAAGKEPRQRMVDDVSEFARRG